MSYILDALRKSDQQRQRGLPPTLLAPQTAADEPRSRVSVSHALLAAALVGAGILLGALRPWQTEQPATTREAPARTPLDTSSAPSSVPLQPQTARKSEQAALPRELPPPIPSAAVLDHRVEERQAPAAAEPQPRPRARATPRQAARPAPQPAAKAVPEQPKSGGTGEAQEQKVLTMAELPLSVRQEMPRLTILVHAYSREPKERLVGINDRILHEGEDVAPGLRLEEITPEGMILHYQGYRIRHGVR